MAFTLTISEQAVNAQADALARLLDGGYLRMYDGSQPADADTALTTQAQLAELRFSNPCAPAAVGGVLTFDSVLSDIDADATGAATWYRCYQSDGVTPVLDGSVGSASAMDSDLLINSVAIQIHAQVDVTSFTHIVPKT